MNIRCGIVCKLNECEFAYLGDGFTGCSFKDKCIYQRPYAKEICGHFKRSGIKGKLIVRRCDLDEGHRGDHI